MRLSIKSFCKFGVLLVCTVIVTVIVFRFVREPPVSRVSLRREHPRDIYQPAAQPFKSAADVSPVNLLKLCALHHNTHLLSLL